jgi:hypothetical protein
VGHRATYVLVEAGKQEIYFSNWGALRLGHDIFFGPEQTVPFVRRHMPDDRLLDECFCEGGALLDLDRRHLLFFSWYEIDEPVVCRHFLALTRLNYAGWTLQYAEDGIVDICRYMGRDPAEVVRLDSSTRSSLTPPPFAVEPRARMTDAEALDRIENHLLSAAASFEETERFVDGVVRAGCGLFPHARHLVPWAGDEEGRRRTIRKRLAEYRSSPA